VSVRVEQRDIVLKKKKEEGGFERSRVSFWSTVVSERQSSRIAATNITSKNSSEFFANHFMFLLQPSPRTCNRHCELRDSRNDDFVSSAK